MMAKGMYFRLLVATAAIAAAASALVLLAGTGPAGASFPGTNGRIAFVSDRDGDADIYTRSLAGGNVKRLTNNSAADLSPAWSADGKKIVYSSDRAGDSGIYTMDADGSDKRLLTDEASMPGRKKDDSGPAFSPGGKRIVFTRAGDLYTISTGGSNLTRLTDNGAGEGEAVWSPDGEKLAFASGNGVFVMDLADGSFGNVARFGGSPDWSPDGTRITYHCPWIRVCDPSDPENPSNTLKWDVYTMAADGSDKVRLTTDRASYDPAFSPDGDKIVYSSKRDGDYDLYTMDADGTDRSQLTNNPARESLPAWQPAQ
jgi:Tol biopolymer transport system component